MIPFDLSVYLVTDARLCAARGLIATVLAAVRGGATLVQLRDKDASDAELVDLGRALQAALAGSRARLIINDRIAVAEAIGADGLHLGQSDTDPEYARARLGSRAIIGLSVQTAAHARAAASAPIDYLGIGPVFATATKSDRAAPLGFAGLRAICAAAPALPKVAIGGLNASHARAVIAAGAQGLALVSAICAAENPEAATRAVCEQVTQARAALTG